MPHALRSVEVVAEGSDSGNKRGRHTGSGFAESKLTSPPLANIFQSHVGVVVALGFGAPGSTVHVELSSEVSHPAAVVHHAGGENRRIIGAASAGSIVYVVELGVDGEAMLQLS